MLLNNQWITEEVKEKKMPRDKWKQNKKKKTQWSKTYGIQKSAVLRGKLL